MLCVVCCIALHCAVLYCVVLCCIVLKKLKYTPAVRSKICRNSSLQAVCDTPIARITSCVSSLRIEVGDSACNYSVAIRVNRVMLGSLFTETVKPVSEGDKI